MKNKRNSDMGRREWLELHTKELADAAKENRKPRSVSRILGRTVVVNLAIDDRPQRGK